MAGPLGIEYNMFPIIDAATLAAEPMFNLLELQRQMEAVNQSFIFVGENPETGRILIEDRDGIIQDIFPTQFKMLCALGKVENSSIPIVIEADEITILI